MGMHLGEGYIFHTEEAKQRKIKPRSRNDLDSAPLILMITSERVLFLNGKLDRNFCSVVWETMFLNIVHLELIPGDMSLDMSSTFDEVIIWYLLGAAFATGNAEDRTVKYSKALASGVDVLGSKSVFVPRETGELLLSKMANVDKRLLKNFE
jgi:hypothetical protein